MMVIIAHLEKTKIFMAMTWYPHFSARPCWWTVLDMSSDLLVLSFIARSCDDSLCSGVGMVLDQQASYMHFCWSVLVTGWVFYLHLCGIVLRKFSNLRISPTCRLELEGGEESNNQRQKWVKKVGSRERSKISQAMIKHFILFSVPAFGSSCLMPHAREPYVMLGISPVLAIARKMPYLLCYCFISHFLLMSLDFSPFIDNLLQAQTKISSS